MFVEEAQNRTTALSEQNVSQRLFLCSHSESTCTHFESRVNPIERVKLVLARSRAQNLASIQITLDGSK